MRISDWSSDVCSSDLPIVIADDRSVPDDRAAGSRRRPPQHDVADPAPLARGGRAARDDRGGAQPDGHRAAPRAAARRDHGAGRDQLRQPRAARRSEEHTSELQSLMRISYAVFCLKKKNTTTQYNTMQTHYKHIR